MKEHPILFSTPMVQAILEGRKTVTRRVVTRYNSSFEGTIGGWQSLDFSKAWVDGDRASMQYLHVPNPEWETSHRIYPKYDPKEILWVRETWGRVVHVNSTTWESKDGYRYKADLKGEPIKGHDKFKPSIHMPRAACRLRLEIQSIQVERLHEITEEDAFKEGIDAENEDYCAAEHYQLGGSPIEGGSPARFAFIALWQRINGAESWNANPWVWRTEFEKL